MKHVNLRIRAYKKVIIGGILATAIALIVPPWKVYARSYGRTGYIIEWKFLFTPPTVTRDYQHYSPSISLSILTVEIVFIGSICAGTILYLDKGNRNV